MEGNRQPKNQRPPGLHGKQIGMFYRNLSKMRKRQEEQLEKPKIRLGPSVIIPKEILNMVDESLQKFTLTYKNEEEQIQKEYETQIQKSLLTQIEDFIEVSKRNAETARPNNEPLNNRLKSELLKKDSSEEFRKRYELREKLPVMKQYDKIMNMIQENQVILIVGSTGCGKTTQVPQMILDEYIYSKLGSKCYIVCTQPRRISAVTVAERVAYERCETLGESVGYQIRLDSAMPRQQGAILYCTTGVLLQRMQTDLLLNDFSVIILDEVHERNVETDLLMALIKKILPHRPDLKIILMSATIRESDFSNYFSNCAMVRVEGTLFTVKVQYLEDILQETGFTKFESNNPDDSRKRHGKRAPRRLIEQKNIEFHRMMEPYLRQIRDQYDRSVIQTLNCPESEGCQNLNFIEFLIFHICEHKPPGAILVFLPGYDRISKLNSILQKPTQANWQRFRNKIIVYPLHSLLPLSNQQSVFKPAPNGIRKVILSTIIAETSVTIDDVVYVINTGRTKISRYDITANVQTLEETWVTKANSMQRKGRAGRVQPGICYNLFSRAREQTMEEVPLPEILCSKLEMVILRLKLFHISDIFQFMQTLLTPPVPTVVEHGLNLLKRIEALDESDTLTPLGVHLARLPIDPQMGKMILMASIFRCLDPITSAAAALSFKSPFHTPLGQERKVDEIRRELCAGLKSDHLLVDNVILSYREALNDGLERDFCYKNFLSLSTLQQLEGMKQQFCDLLTDAYFIGSSIRDNEAANSNSKNIPLLRAILAAGLYPNMAFLRKIRLTKNRVNAIHHMSTPEDKRVNFHPSSVNYGDSSFPSHFFVYFQKQKSSGVFLMDATMIYPMALIIFGDQLKAGYTEDNIFYLSVGNAYNFKCNEETVAVIMKLRQRLKWLMQKKALYPSPIVPNSSEECLTEAIQYLLSLDEVDNMDDKYLSDSE